MTYTAHASVYQELIQKSMVLLQMKYINNSLMNKAPWYELRTQNKAQILLSWRKKNGYSAFINSWPFGRS